MSKWVRLWAPQELYLGFQPYVSSGLIPQWFSQPDIMETLLSGTGVPVLEEPGVRLGPLLLRGTSAAELSLQFLITTPWVWTSSLSY